MKLHEERIQAQFDKLQRFILFPLSRKKRQGDHGPRYGDVYERAVAAAIDVSLVFLMLDWLFGRINVAMFSHIDMAKVGAIDPKAGLITIVSKLWDAHLIQWWAINFGIQIAIIGIFYVACQMAYHTTPGKWLLGLKVVRHGTNEAPENWRYILRYIAYVPACAPLMLGVIWAAFSNQRRGWHDYIAGTDVLNTRPYGWYWGQIKRGFRYVKAKLTGSAPLEQPVGEPTAEQRHGDGDKPVQ